VTAPFDFTFNIVDETSLAFNSHKVNRYNQLQIGVCLEPDPKSTMSNGVKVNGHYYESARKPSNPLMPPFMVSAPGKVIVFGEHAVVHGKV
jgi:hypothetical protein